MQTIIYISLAFLSAGLLVGCQSPKENEKQHVEKQGYCIHTDFKRHIQMETIQQRDVAEQIALNGSIQYNQDELAVLKSPVQGIVQSVAVNMGDYVKKGQVLIALKGTSVNDLGKELRELENNKRLIDRKLIAQRNLFKDGMVSQRELEEMESEWRAVEIGIQHTRSKMKLLNGSSEDGTFYIRAPKAGYIVDKKISPGMTVDDNADLLSVSNLNEVWAAVNIYANNLPFVKNGARVKITTLAYKGEYFEGQIDQIANFFDPEERVVKARVKLLNNDLRLKPGMSVDVLVEKEIANQGQRMLAIPKSAIILHNNQNYVVIYSSDCDMSVKPVDIVAENETYAFIQQGVQEGDRVLTENELIVFDELMNR
ncbi:efflux RND transporter periplasmic adaptor subunit [Sphingobacterium sp. N143]|uniref:efflux RND transporter periplasmic adaptor subunit n=1 Tax=Sphingobacterium sp. N143 TaxID=2746727 RepID=UPI0025788BFC|nr:efflux RND transporter periplasmic adaptor subunit [Sphingobacterium sp. N143]MDM1294163.1 efflux RND transporter periplasmic adaptor subunit [Sphingobacterium sp. N143]